MSETSIVSDWNEANLKMKRLHDAQERINFYKRDPKGFTDGKFNYVWWIKDIDVLLGEGKAKYDKEEKEKAERIKAIIDGRLRLYPPQSVISIGTSGGNKKGYKINDENYNILLELIESYEDLVKDFNDRHGLSTKNKGNQGLF